MNFKQEILEAEKRIRPYINETPLEYSRYLSHIIGGRVFLKLENVQRTGSFKFRGAANFLLSLPEEQLRRGPVTASTGNHAAAVAEMLETLDQRGTVYLPETTSSTKLELLRTYKDHLELVLTGTDCETAETAARAEAEKQNRPYISPYNHPAIIAGQGTIAPELLRQQPEFDAVLATVGGGGLMSGISGYLKSVRPGIACIGCQPENSPVMYRSVEAGHIVEMESSPTLSDASAGGIEQGSITFDICKKTVDDFILVPEEEIAAAIRLMLEHHHMLVEGAAALPVAAVLQKQEQFRGQTVILIISGRKIALETLKSILE